MNGIIDLTQYKNCPIDLLNWQQKCLLAEGFASVTSCKPSHLNIIMHTD